MGEAGGVEVDAQAVLFGKGHPRLEVFVLQLVAVHPLALGKHGVGRMQVDALFAGDEGGGLEEVSLQLLKIAGLAGIVAGGLDAVAGLAVLLVEAGHVVALPAVDRDGLVCQALQRGLHIHADGGIALFCGFKLCHGCTSVIGKLVWMAARAVARSTNSPAAIICTIRLPSAVPSVGPANTGSPAALAVSAFR